MPRVGFFFWNPCVHAGTLHNLTLTTSTLHYVTLRRDALVRQPKTRIWKASVLSKPDSDYYYESKKTRALYSKQGGCNKLQ